ncbi:MAG: ABC transporter permease [Verrucomicrobia bacterium]|nr:MAG: ABC transporter permease [Verrucomicrobiota bacterium]
MALPLNYSLRNALVRWRSTIATVLGIALVVFVFVLLQSLAAGIEKSSSNTGDPRNIMVVRKGSTAESASLISRQTLTEIRYFEEIARNENGEPIISADVLVLASLPRRDGSGEANVLLRGVTARGLELRPQVKISEGRWFEAGKREIVVSAKLAKRFANFDIGQSFKTGSATFTVVGWLEGGGSAFDSECWLDADECLSTFERDMYSSFLIQPSDEGAGEKLIARIEADRRFKLKAEKEVEYYRKQTMTAAPIKWLGGFLAVMMSVGAVFAAMNTMYAAVGARTREIGTLRVLGFRRRSVVAALLLEGGLLALVGGVLGCAIAFYWNGYTTATMGMETFSEIVFEFRVTPKLVVEGLVFAFIVGLIGTLFPAIRAARLPVILALKSI